MNRYIMIRRLRGPAFLLLVGVNALLNEAHILSWGRSWPLYLILAGLLALAERASITAEGAMPPAPYPGAPYGVPGVPPVQPTQGTTTSSALVPAHEQEYMNDPRGGQS